MVTYIDRHAELAIPTDVLVHLIEDDLRARTEASGVRPLGHWAMQGYVYCVLEAPDVDAVAQYHAQHGLECSDVHPLVGLGDDPQSRSPTRRRAVVRVHIRRIWHG